MLGSYDAIRLETCKCQVLEHNVPLGNIKTRQDSGSQPIMLSGRINRISLHNKLYDIFVCQYAHYLQTCVMYVSIDNLHK